MPANTFWIGWDEVESDHASERAGRIVLDDLNESFIAVLVTWQSADYETQWREGAERIVRGESVSALVTSIHSVDGGFRGFFWPMYRADDHVAIRHQLVLPETLPAFDPDNPYASVGPRGRAPVSEWLVPVSALSAFLG
jgi:hypothetical protein